MSIYSVVHGRRYGYSALDLYRGTRCERTIIAGLKKKDAKTLEGEINNLIDKVEAETLAKEK